MMRTTTTKKYGPFVRNTETLTDWPIIRVTKSIGVRIRNREYFLDYWFEND